MNERVDALHRQAMNKFADEQKKELKGKRYQLLRSQVSLKVRCLKRMAKTIRKRGEGLLGFWGHQQRQPGRFQRQDRMARTSSLWIQGRRVRAPEDMRPARPLHRKGPLNRDP
ncbi:hypothetical protein [Pelagicoccus mobilis]|uniref:Uncharacterized protein n=1 Tax=Pelagicoccus mobilis TaxID=415221 RepID=A0A934RXE2_9BACT|nr:hypothetical protein [Pelagicoccus mobilis]MBK1877230.1 hypothetical protein [Pelagicoccus mobilis]